MLQIWELCFVNAHLTNINLSNFNSNNVDDMFAMFEGCKSLNKNNLIIKDKKILNDEDSFFE